MFCSVCKEVAAVDVMVSHKNRFTSGNYQLKLESIKLHEEWRNHKSAKATVAAKRTVHVKHQLWNSCLPWSVQLIKEKLTKLLKTFYKQNNS